MTNANEPASPCLMQTDIISRWITTPGLTKREKFAAMAMQGMLSSSYEGYDAKAIADTSVILADALIAALNKSEE